MVEPLPIGAADSLAVDGIWQRLSQQSAGPMIQIEAAWSFGGISDAAQFAHSMVAALGATLLVDNAVSLQP